MNAESAIHRPEVEAENVISEVDLVYPFSGKGREEFRYRL